MKIKTPHIPAIAVSLGICIFIYGLITRFGSLSAVKPPAVEGRKTGGTTYSRRISAGEKYIVIDRYCNKLYLRTADRVLLAANCSTGSGVVLIDRKSNRRWKFETPAGIYAVQGKLVEPWWRKPDWAFIEENEPIPDTESERFDPEMLGEYALGFGNGYFIHGTIYEKLLGVSVTHGCVRLGSEDLKKLYDNVHEGTLIYIY